MNRIYGVSDFYQAVPAGTVSTTQQSGGFTSRLLADPKVLAALGVIAYTAYAKKTILPLASIPLLFGGAMAGFGNRSGTGYAMWAAAAASVIYPWIKKK